MLDPQVNGLLRMGAPHLRAKALRCHAPRLLATQNLDLKKRGDRGVRRLEIATSSRARQLLRRRAPQRARG